MISKEQFEDLRCGDVVKCIKHQKEMSAVELAPEEYKGRLSCGCPFTRLLIVSKI